MSTPRPRPKTEAALRLKAEGLPDEEIAKRIGSPVRSVYSLLYSAKHRERYSQAKRDWWARLTPEAKAAYQHRRKCRESGVPID